MRKQRYIEDTEDDDDFPDAMNEFTMDRPVPCSKNPRKFKYKDKEFRIEVCKEGQPWKLLKYYRSEADMRKAFGSAGSGDERRHIPSNKIYRMVFPNGLILPRIRDSSYPR